MNESKHKYLSLVPIVINGRLSESDLSCPIFSTCPTKFLETLRFHNHQARTSQTHPDPQSMTFRNISNGVSGSGPPGPPNPGNDKSPRQSHALIYEISPKLLDCGLKMDWNLDAFVCKKWSVSSKNSSLRPSVWAHPQATTAETEVRLTCLSARSLSLGNNCALLVESRFHTKEQLFQLLENDSLDQAFWPSAKCPCPQVHVNSYLGHVPSEPIAPCI